uniref:Uncharacterized protein n=1 Tax=viral metagenome TaxID=1070528 RepID=A0A6C0AGM5_9ZZZZ
MILSLTFFLFQKNFLIIKFFKNILILKIKCKNIFFKFLD